MIKINFNLQYFFHSIKTWSYWSYAILSPHSRATFFSVLGSIWLLLEMAIGLEVFTLEQFPENTMRFSIILAVIIVIITRRPISRISYKIPNRDIVIEVIINDLFKINGQKVISTNNTFDTNISDGIIAENSIQGQFTKKYFPRNISDLDAQIEKSLQQQKIVSKQKIKNPLKKSIRYDIGTVAQIDIGENIFYFLSMAELNDNGTADSGGLPNIKRALNGLWEYVSNRGEKETLIVPLIGTGRGRLATPRKKMIEHISQSFINYSNDRSFVNKLVICISPDDAKNFEINLFEIKDYLKHSLEY